MMIGDFDGTGLDQIRSDRVEDKSGEGSRFIDNGKEGKGMDWVFLYSTSTVKREVFN